MPIFAGQLVQDQELICVNPHDSLTHALTLMIERDFSQLPVVDQENVPLGIVTTASIAKALLHLGAKVEDLRVDHAIIKLSIYSAEEDLLYLLDTILKDSAVFVKDANEKLIGIITEYDTTQYFRQRAEDLLLVNEIEDSLKLHLKISYDIQNKESLILRDAIDSLSNSLDGVRKKSNASLKALCKSKDIKYTSGELDIIVDKHFPLKEEPRAFEDLALSEFIQLAQKNWPKLEPAFGLTQAPWSKMMDDVRLIRNKLFHFRGDTSVVERHKLKYCANWYANHSPITSKDEITAAPTLDPILPDASDHKEMASGTPTRPTRGHRNNLYNENLITVKYQAIAQVLDENASIADGTTFPVSVEYLNEKLPMGLPRGARESFNWWTRSSPYSAVWVQRGWRPIGLDHKWILFQKQAIPDDKAPIELNDPWEVAYWCAELNHTENQLLEAVRIAGPIPIDIRKYLLTENFPPAFAISA